MDRLRVTLIERIECENYQKYVLIDRGQYYSRFIPP
jgi:hypothetical protein